MRGVGRPKDRDSGGIGAAMLKATRHFQKSRTDGKIGIIASQDASNSTHSWVK